MTLYNTSIQWELWRDFSLIGNLTNLNARYDADRYIPDDSHFAKF